MIFACKIETYDIENLCYNLYEKTSHIGKIGISVAKYRQCLDDTSVLYWREDEFVNLDIGQSNAMVVIHYILGITYRYKVSIW